MMRILASIAMAILAIVILAVYLPLFYQKIFFSPVEKTHLFYSPVINDFIYTEKIIGTPPPEAMAKADDHHCSISYRDAKGNYYTRKEFEKMLPFIYYKNMEMWGLLPLRLQGRTLDKENIKRDRRVIQLKPGEIIGNAPNIGFWPLLESNPGRVRLVFPEDRFRMRPTAMEFINADYNSLDKDLTAIFTTALKEKGFVFPARSVNGKFTVLKPFDEGVFIVDATYHVFHILRRNGNPVVIKTPVSPKLATQFIKVSENRQRKNYGILLASDGSLHILTCDNYATIRLPLRNYDSKSMDFKLIANSLYNTAITSNKTDLYAVVMDKNYKLLARYKHRMSRADLEKTLAVRVYKALFPFVLQIDNNKGFLKFTVHTGGMLSLFGIGVSLLFCVIWCLWRRAQFPKPACLALVLLTGIYGLITDLFLSSSNPVVL
ncbi:MAG: DUF4857 domain-containing protein [Desulfobacteraceae bacterium]|nr:DUF4857 domain-containing protein [Desulfobacteraceae bacterium]